MDRGWEPRARLYFGYEFERGLLLHVAKFSLRDVLLLFEGWFGLVLWEIHPYRSAGEDFKQTLFSKSVSCRPGLQQGGTLVFKHGRGTRDGLLLAYNCRQARTMLNHSGAGIHANWITGTRRQEGLISGRHGNLPLVSGAASQAGCHLFTSLLRVFLRSLLGTCRELVCSPQLGKCFRSRLLPAWDGLVQDVGLGLAPPAGRLRCLLKTEAGASRASGASGLLGLGLVACSH